MGDGRLPEGEQAVPPWVGPFIRGVEGGPVSNAPGWYPDQTHAHLVRYWDGQEWTSATAQAPAAPAGAPRAGDPVPSSTSPPTGSASEGSVGKPLPPLPAAPVPLQVPKPAPLSSPLPPSLLAQPPVMGRPVGPADRSRNQPLGLVLLGIAAVMLLATGFFALQDTGPLGLCGNLFDGARIINEANGSESPSSDPFAASENAAQSVVDECSADWTTMLFLAGGAGFGALVAGIFGVIILVGWLPSERHPGAPRSGMAIGSIIASGIGWVVYPGAIIGIVLGFVAKNQIKASGGTQGGDGLATAGIIVGFVGILLGIVWRIVLFSN